MKTITTKSATMKEMKRYFDIMYFKEFSFFGEILIKYLIQTTLTNEPLDELYKRIPMRKSDYLELLNELIEMKYLICDENEVYRLYIEPQEIARLKYPIDIKTQETRLISSLDSLLSQIRDKIITSFHSDECKYRDIPLDKLLEQLEEWPYKLPKCREDYYKEELKQ